MSVQWCILKVISAYVCPLNSNAGNYIFLISLSFLTTKITLNMFTNDYLAPNVIVYIQSVPKLKGNILQVYYRSKIKQKVDKHKHQKMRIKRATPTYKEHLKDDSLLISPNLVRLNL